MDRNETIASIKASLKNRSKKTWSVTGGQGTAWGWIRITAPPSRRTWEYREVYGSRSPTSQAVYESFDTGKPGSGMGPSDREELGTLLGLGKPADSSGESVPASDAYYQEYVDRAAGRTPTKLGTQYWD